MDWPVVGAISGVAALAVGVLGLGAYIFMDSAPSPSARASTSAATATRERLSYNNWAGERYAAPAPSHRFDPAPSSVPFGSAPRIAEPPVQIEREPPPPVPASRPERAKVQPPPVVKPAIPPQERERPVAVPREERPKPARPSIAQPDAEPLQQRPRQDPRFAKVLTPQKIGQMRAALALSREQAPHWPPVAAALHEIGQGQVEQIQRGQDPEVGTGSMMRLYRSAQPLLQMLRPEQKEKVRGLARSLGYANLASMI